MGYKIREVREAKRMTQEELAEKSGVSRGTISALENGSMRNTTSKTLLKLAQALGTSVDQIFFLHSLFNQLSRLVVEVAKRVGAALSFDWTQLYEEPMQGPADQSSA